MKTAIYPGSFDPVHNGHLDVIERASRLWDRLVISVAYHSTKMGLFTPEERVDLIRKTTGHLDNVEVTAFQGLLVDFAAEQNADVAVRGLRAVSDFEYEFQMALMNRNLDEGFETVFLMPSQENIYLSSRIVKEVAGLGGDIRKFVPGVVGDALAARVDGAAS